MPSIRIGEEPDLKSGSPYGFQGSSPWGGAAIKVAFISHNDRTTGKLSVD